MESGTDSREGLARAVPKLKGKYCLPVGFPTCVTLLPVGCSTSLAALESLSTSVAIHTSSLMLDTVLLRMLAMHGLQFRRVSCANSRSIM